MFDQEIKRRLVGLGLTAVIFIALAMPAAQALVSVGVSAGCDADGHCVSGGAEAVNGASPRFAGIDVEVLPDDTGAAEAICSGASNGSTLIEITCTHGNQSNTMSFPGSAGAVPLATTSARLERLPVCWSVKAYFPVVTGAQHIVPTSGCELLGV